MCYCPLNYDYDLSFVMLYIKTLCIIISLTNFQSVISWYFLLQIFKGVKELHKL